MGGQHIEIEVEFYEFEAIVGLFYQTEYGRWKGVLKKQLNDVTVSILWQNDIIILIEQEANRDEC